MLATLELYCFTVCPGLSLARKDEVHRRAVLVTGVLIPFWEYVEGICGSGTARVVPRWYYAAYALTDP